MTQVQIEHLNRIAAKRWRIAVVLTTLMLLAYFGFILLIAFDKPLMGTLLASGRVSLGILIGAGVIVSAWLLTGIYVRWANKKYDGAIAAFKRGDHT